MPTCFIEPNGFGAMYQAMLYGFAECLRRGLAYHHTPLKNIHHGANQARANQLIGFLSYDIATPSTERIEYSKELYSTPIDDLFNGAVLSVIHSEYGRNWKPVNPYRTLDTSYVAVHIRRGDVNASKHPDRFISLNQYIVWVEQLHTIYPSHQILILSEGKTEDFTDLPHYVRLHLGGDPLATFNIMVEADVLFPARSSFSFTAGILNKGIVYCDAYAKAWYHTPSKNWLDLKSQVARCGLRPA